MNEPPPSLPPQLGKWLASRDPVLRVRAEAALREAEPDTNDLLLAQIKAAQTQMFYTYLCTQIPGQFIFQRMPQHHFNRFVDCLVGLAVMLSTTIVLLYIFVRPLGKRLDALVRVLAERGDVRIIPYLLPAWQPTAKKTKHKQSEQENALLSLFQTAEPRKTPLSNHPATSHPSVSLRTKFNRLTTKRKGVVSFAPPATNTPRRVQIWLALLPHLAADTHPQSQTILCRIADARAQTRDEEQIQNAARALLHPNTSPRHEETSTSPKTVAWEPAATSDATTPKQRLGRS